MPRAGACQRPRGARGRLDDAETQQLALSERKELERAIKARLGNRWGSDQHKTKGELPADWPEARSARETRSVAAEEAGFGSVGTSRRVEAVLDAGDPRLTAMMDRGHISPARGMAGSMLARREMRAKQGPCHVRGRQGPVTIGLVPTGTGGPRPALR